MITFDPENCHSNTGSQIYRFGNPVVPCQPGSKRTSPRRRCLHSSSLPHPLPNRLPRVAISDYSADPESGGHSPHHGRQYIQAAAAARPGSPRRAAVADSKLELARCRRRTRRQHQTRKRSSLTRSPTLDSWAQSNPRGQDTVGCNAI
jgi:hypothetical protein